MICVECMQEQKDEDIAMIHMNLNREDAINKLINKQFDQDDFCVCRKCVIAPPYRIIENPLLN
jgi:hypothetical protein